MTSRLYRFSKDPSNGTSAWTAYRSLPERSLDGQMVFALMDPQGVYPYFARLLGFAYNALSYDTLVIANQYDASEASHFFLPYLAQQYGLKLAATDPLAVQRSKVNNAVQVFKKKGLADSVALRVRDFGYVGYAYEVFVNTGDTMGQLTNSNNGAIGNVPITFSSSIDALTVYGMRGGSAVSPATGVIDFQSRQSPIAGDWLAISDGLVTKTFYFTATTAPAGMIPVLFGTSQSGTMDNLCAAISANLAISAVNITKTMTSGPPLNGQPTSSTPYGTRSVSCLADFREYPHGYFSDIQPIYSLSSRITVHVNHRDGSPLLYLDNPQDQAAAVALQEQIGSDLSYGVLPAHVDVMCFITDFNVMGPGAEETVGIGETFTITQV